MAGGSAILSAHGLLAAKPLSADTPICPDPIRSRCPDVASLDVGDFPDSTCRKIQTQKFAFDYPLPFPAMMNLPTTTEETTETAT